MTIEGSGGIGIRPTTKFRIEGYRVTTYTQTGSITHKVRKPAVLNFSGKTGRIEISPEINIEISDGGISITNSKGIKL